MDDGLPSIGASKKPAQPDFFNVSNRLEILSLLERLYSLVIEGKAVLLPETTVLVAIPHANRSVAVDVALRTLNGLNQLSLLHFIRIDPHAFCHLPDVVVFHKSLSERVNTLKLEAIWFPSLPL
jgi:hypothetical protein